MDVKPMNVHATCVAVDDAGILIIGPPGSGKSSLALRLIDASGYGLSGRLMRAELVSDDQVIVTRQNQVLLASAPPTIAGKLEIRGLDIVSLSARSSVALALVVRLSGSQAIDRLPLQKTYEIMGVALPVVEIDETSASATARTRAALNWFTTKAESVARAGG